MTGEQIAAELPLLNSAAVHASLTWHSRRHAILSSAAAASAAAAPVAASAPAQSNVLAEVSDGTYSALAYAPRTPRDPGRRFASDKASDAQCNRTLRLRDPGTARLYMHQTLVSHAKRLCVTRHATRTRVRVHAAPGTSLRRRAGEEGRLREPLGLSPQSLRESRVGDRLTRRYTLAARRLKV